MNVYQVCYSKYFFFSFLEHVSFKDQVVQQELTLFSNHKVGIRLPLKYYREWFTTFSCCFLYPSYSHLHLYCFSFSSIFVLVSPDLWTMCYLTFPYSALSFLIPFPPCFFFGIHTDSIYLHRFFFLAFLVCIRLFLNVLRMVSTSVYLEQAIFAPFILIILIIISIFCWPMIR